MKGLKMKTLLLNQLIKTIMTILSPELLKKFADTVLDFVEDYVEGTKSSIDDALVLPLCDLIRTTFNIPDDDEGDA